MTPSERVNRILGAYGNSNNVLVISNHLNAGGGEGAEVIYALRNNDSLATSILNELNKEGEPVRKAYQRRLPSDNTKDYYFIHRNTGNTEPIIVEYGFVDNTKDANRIKNNWENYAEAVVRAVANNKGFKYQEPYSSEVYTVQRGDTLWSISKKLNTSVNEIKKLNNLSNNLLYIGQSLRVPEYQKAEETNISYVVKKGDSLWSISKQYDVPVSEIKRYNNLTSDNLSVGMIIKIPSATTIVTPSEEEIISEGTIYTVKIGDTLYSIAKQYNVSVDDIVNQNNLVSNNLTIGTKLLIPSGKSSDIIVYTVQRGDSLWALANNYNTTIDDIKRLNNLTSDVLTVGQKLQIKKNTKN